VVGIHTERILIEGIMKIEEFERLKQGAKLIDEINSYKFFLEDTEQALKQKDDIEGGTLYTEGENKIRIPLNKEVALKAIEMAIADHKITLARLEKEFEKL
jgi:hypothetical protein